MDKLLDKIGSYNIFNNLLPGVIFYCLIARFTKFVIVTGELIYDAFLIYFFGLVLSRVGSIIIEPLFKSWKIVKFASFEDYCIASKNDPTLAVLTEVNNTYRSLIATLAVFGIAYLLDKINIQVLISGEIVFAFILIATLTLLVFSFRKQTKYIKQLVKTDNKPEVK